MSNCLNWHFVSYEGDVPFPHVITECITAILKFLHDIADQFYYPLLSLKRALLSVYNNTLIASCSGFSTLLPTLT